MSDASARPRQVTTAAWLAGGGSAALAMTVATTMAGLNSLDTREALTDFIDRMSLGVAPAELLPWLRIGLYVVGVVAAVGVVSSIYVTKRDRMSRILLTVCAVLAFISGLFLSPFLAAMIGVAATLLWSGPANDWFAGRPVREIPTRLSAAEQERTTDPHPQATVVPLAQLPRSVRLAGILAVTSSTAVFMLMLIASIGVLTGANQQLRERVESDPRFAQLGLTFEMVQAMALMALAAVALWAVFGAVVGFLVLRGVRWSRLALLISGTLAGGFALVSVIASPAYLVIALACAASVWLMARREAAEWFSGVRRP